MEVGTFEFDVFGSEEKPYCLYSYWEYDYSLADYLVPMGTEAKGSVTLDEYDEGTGDLKGTFNCVLYHVSGHGISDAPDSLVFTDGYFHTKILE